jgi:hypothetical protein
MGEAASHVFTNKWAAPALRQAMGDLASQTGRTIDELEGITLGDAYEQAVDSYGAELPEFWRIWASWNDMPDGPAEMGDL